MDDYDWPDLNDAIDSMNDRIEELKAVNAELLAALKRIRELDYGECDNAPSIAIAAIAYADNRVKPGDVVAENQANARLIAAAPELLHCLKVILDHTDGDEMLEAQLHLDFVRAAIAKAEGE
jgi:hypothetical protein